MRYLIPIVITVAFATLAALANDRGADVEREASNGHPPTREIDRILDFGWTALILFEDGEFTFTDETCPPGTSPVWRGGLYCEMKWGLVEQCDGTTKELPFQYWKAKTFEESPRFWEENDDPLLECMNGDECGVYRPVCPDSAFQHVSLCDFHIEVYRAEDAWIIYEAMGYASFCGPATCEPCP